MERHDYLLVLNMLFRELLTNSEYCLFHHPGYVTLTFDNHSEFNGGMGID